MYCNNYTSSRVSECPFTDVLINYSKLDEDIMKEMFLKPDGLTGILEEDHDFKLVLHQRDFLPGAAILHNIAHAVETSRRMVMLLSR